MSTNYFYLISSLPSLYADMKIPFSYSKFLDMCRNLVSEKTYKELENLNSDTNKTAFLRQWSDFRRQLFGALNSLRNAKLGKESRPFTDSNSTIDNVVNKAMASDNPLEAEQILIRAQFNFLDDKCAMHYFDDVVLFSYALKLKLLERKNTFVAQNGKKEFERLFSSIQQQIYNI